MVKNDVIQITVPTPFAVGNVHVYLLKGDVLTLIDAGVKTEEAWDALKTGLRQYGYIPDDIEQIVLTHHHPDHTGLIEQFPRVQNIAGDQALDPWLRRDEAYLARYEHFFYNLFEQCGIPKTYHHALHNLRASLDFSGKGEISNVLQEGDELPGHPGWKVIDTKGHAQSHLSFWHEREGTLVGGDHLLHHISPNPLIEPPACPGDLRPKPLLQYRENVKKCIELNIREVLPGHGICFSDVTETISQQLSKQEERSNKVLKLLQQGAMTPFEVCRAIFPRHYEKQLNLTMSETIGQLDYLASMGLIRPTENQGLVYEAVGASC